MDDHVHGRRRDSNVYDTLNMLVYEYLKKMGYEGSAEAFFEEAAIGDFKTGEGAPLLAQWYAAFHDISLARSGISQNIPDLSRIEGIMMALESEKRRCQHMNRMDHGAFGYGWHRNMDMHRQHPMYYTPQQTDQRKTYDGYGQQIPFSMMQNPGFYDQRRGGPDYRVGSGSNGRCSSKMDEYAQPTKAEWLSSSDRGGNFGTKQPVVPNVRGSNFQQGNSKATDDRSFGLKEIISFSSNEKPLICSVVAKEHKLLIAASSNRTIVVINLLSGKTEAISETSGKQVRFIKIREFDDHVIIVCDVNGNELLLMRYYTRESAILEAVGFLKGHSSPIVCYEVADFIYSFDNGGIMKRWSLDGVFEREEMLSKDILCICCISGDNFIFSDSRRVYVYDFELNIEMMEVLEGHVSEIRRVDEGFIVVFKNKVVLLNKRVQVVRTLNLNCEPIRMAVLIDNDVVSVSSHDAWISGASETLCRCRLHEALIIGLDSVNVFRKQSIVSCSANGECKVWIKQVNE